MAGHRPEGVVLALVAAVAVPVAVLVAPNAFAADGPYSIDGTIPDPWDHPELVRPPTAATSRSSAH